MFTGPLQQLTTLTENHRRMQEPEEGGKLCPAIVIDSPAQAATGITMMPLNGVTWNHLWEAMRYPVALFKDSRRRWADRTSSSPGKARAV